MTLPYISVVVPTYRRPDLLQRCLEALLNQDYPRHQYEIIVVDDADDPYTRNRVETLAQTNDAYVLWPKEREQSPSRRFVSAKVVPALTEAIQAELVRVNAGPTIRYIPVTGEHGPAAARNAGWNAAEGQIIAFTDDDTIPSAGWLTAGVAAFTGETVGVSGKIVMPIPMVPTDYERDAAGLERSEFVTANCFYQKKALEAVGGFDTRFKVAWREDTDLFFALLEEGCKLVHAPDAVVVHPIRTASWGISIRQQKKSMYNALLYKKHPTLYREKVQAKPPFFYYVCVLTFCLAIALLLLGLTQLFAVAFSIWLGLTFAFMTLRLRGTNHTRNHVVEMAVTSAIIPFLSVFWRLYGAITYRTWFF